MGKQALGMYALSHQVRTDTITHVLDYPQRPLVSTIPADFLGFADMPSGINAVVAICCYSGFNQEDSIIVNKQAIERGLFVSSSYRTLVEQEFKQGPYSSESICVPPYDKRNRNANYSLLDERGIVRKRGPTGDTYVKKGDVIVGKILIKSNKLNEEQIIDRSYVIKHGEEGYIDRIIETTTSNGYKMIKVVIRNQHVPEIGDKLACLKNCEVLTTNGWKEIKDIKINDKVAILDNDNVKYENPLEIHNYDYDGKMYELKSQQVELNVTPNHRMWIKKRYYDTYKEDFEFLRADQCFGKRLKYKKNIKKFEPEKWIGEKFVIPEFIDGNGLFREKIIVDMKDWLSFFGIWIAEGCSNNMNVYFADNKHRVQKVLDECVSNMSFKINKTKYDNELITNLDGSIVEKGKCKWEICNVQLANYMKQFSVGAVNKFLPEWVWNLNSEQCKLLLSSMELGDGYTSKSNNRLYYTSSKRLCDDVTRLALHAGYSTYSRVPEGRKAGTESIMKDGRIIKSSKDNWVITIIKTKTEPEINHGHSKTQNGQSEEWVDYKGKVYCLSVRTGVFLVRQNGKPVWSGNSRSAQKGVIGCMFPQEDLPFTKDGIVPDLLINAHCIPSRMTVAQLLETVLGKSCTLSGNFGDGTPFTKNSIDNVEKICEELSKFGFQRQGYEIMYSGITGEPLEALVSIGTPFYQRLKHMVSAKIHCLDFHTEVLTKLGWKKYNEISLNDEIACLKQGNLVYEKPLNILIYKDYEGLIYTIKNNYIDMKVTGNHRMFVKFKGKTEYEFVKAEELLGVKGISYKAHAILENYEYTPPDFEVCNIKYWLIFFGMYFQLETKLNTITFSIFNMQTLEKCLKRLGYSYKKTRFTSFYNKIKLEDEKLVKYLEKIKKDILPDWIFLLSSNQVEYLLFGLSMGTSAQKTNFSEGGVNQFDVSFVNNKIVDQVQQLCAQSGICAKIHEDCNTALVFIKEEDLIIDEAYDEESLKIEKCPVYCLEVPSEILLTRRNGKVVYTGNSRAQGHVTTLTHQPLEGRSREGGLRFGEMERDAMISHGTSRFLKERLFEQSDPYQIYICDLCGNTATTPTYCKSCETDKISKVNYPYAGKVLQQNLNAMSIKTKMIVKK